MARAGLFWPPCRALGKQGIRKLVESARPVSTQAPERQNEQKGQFRQGFASGVRTLADGCGTSLPALPLPTNGRFGPEELVGHRRRELLGHAVFCDHELFLGERPLLSSMGKLSLARVLTDSAFRPKIGTHGLHGVPWAKPLWGEAPTLSCCAQRPCAWQIPIYPFRSGYDERSARTAGRVEGKAEGKAEGIAEGKAAGIAEGITKGITKGISEERKRNVLSMHSRGFSAGSIADILVIEEKEVEEIISSLKA